VGRADELARIVGLVEGVREGRAQGLLVVGPAGVGKTRLLAEASHVARDRGVLVGCSACLPLTTSLPFDVVLGLLRGLGEPINLPVGGSSRELFGDVVARLEGLAAAGPVLLCVDDLQWSDVATLELVHYCLARLSDLPMGWLLAARPDAGARLLAHRLERAGLAERIELAPLSLSETRLLVQTALGQERIDEELVEVLFARTNGNPLLCEQLLRAAAMQDLAGGGRWSTALADLVPEGVIEATRERAARLAPALRPALDWATVLPVPFTSFELEMIAGQDAGNAPEALAQAGFLAPDGHGGWSFVHSIVRDAIYRGLPERDRVRRHKRVADAFADGPLQRLAPQLVSAQQWNQAAGAYLRLGQEALNRGKGEDAAQLYARSRELAARGDDKPLGRDAHAGLVLALLHADAADDAHREATALGSDLRLNGEPGERLAFLSRYAMGLMMLRETLDDLERARDALTEAEALLEQAADAPLARLLAARAWLSLRSRDPARALVDAEHAAALVHGDEDTGLEVWVLNSLGLAVGIARSAEGVAGWVVEPSGLSGARGYGLGWLDPAGSGCQAGASRIPYCPAVSSRWRSVPLVFTMYSEFDSPWLVLVVSVINAIVRPFGDQAGLVHGHIPPRPGSFLRWVPAMSMVSIGPEPTPSRSE
jgi:predicted ATPase